MSENKLRELTHEHHKKAEDQPFAQLLMSGNIPRKTYATFLFNQHPQYNLLETLANIYDLLDVRIAPRIHDDYQELWQEFEPHQPPMLSVVKEYMSYLMTISHDPDRVMAHLYVRHMGDLSGGQIISKKVPGSATMYQFDSVKQIKDKVRARCNNSMADEANVCFDYATKMFNQMAKINE